VSAPVAGDEVEMRTVLAAIHGPVFGGGFNQLIELREALERRGWETLAVASDEPGNAVQRLREASAPHVVMPLRRLRATPNPLTHARFIGSIGAEVRALRRLIREREIDLVQAHGDTNPHVAIAGHLEGVAVVWEIYDTRTPPPLRRVTMPLVTRLADVITTWGDGLARVHPGVDSLGERHVVVFPPVDSTRFRPDEQRRAESRRALGVSPDAFLFGSVGNLNPTKGHEWLVRSLRIARAHDEAIEARVLGESSPVHADYERLVRAEAAGLGTDGAFAIVSPSGRVADLMPGLDALVVSSVPRSEGIPTVVLEAMSTGLPVIATTVGAIDEVVEHERTGLMVAPRDPKALASAMRSLAADRARALEMGRRGREHVLERYQLEVCAERRVRAYELALEHRRHRRRGG
jgi:glycosyltransferase involved in cell wall biosynthesis